MVGSSLARCHVVVVWPRVTWCGLCRTEAGAQAVERRVLQKPNLKVDQDNLDQAPALCLAL